jgi:hypothetical protein
MIVVVVVLTATGTTVATPVSVERTPAVGPADSRSTAIDRDDLDGRRAARDDGLAAGELA